MLITAAVSSAGVTARIAWGIVAENPPTPKPSTPMATTGQATPNVRVLANKAQATVTTTPLAASSVNGAHAQPRANAAGDETQ